MWWIVARRQGLTNLDKINAEVTGVKAAASAVGQTYTFNFVVLFFVRQVTYSRLLFLMSALILFISTIFVRSVFRAVLRLTIARRPASMVLIVGTGHEAGRVAVRVQDNSFFRCLVVGFVQLPGADVKACNSPVYQLGEIETLRQLSIDEVFIALPQDRYGDLQECVTKLEALCKPIRVVLDLGGQMQARERILKLGSLQMLDLDTSPASSAQYYLAKRVFDIAFSLLALVFLSPVALLAALATKLSSPGPILFSQERVGESGENFVMYKFRTMRVAAPGESDTLWTTNDDPRRTWVGTWLRKTSLDELPQFLNVLKGDMSVVGPRPERPYFVSKFRTSFAQYNNRHRLKVGITGWAQVNGWRGDSSIEKRLACDLFYIENWSFGLDLRIILMTLWPGYLGKNAY